MGFGALGDARVARHGGVNGDAAAIAGDFAPEEGGGLGGSAPHPKKEFHPGRELWVLGAEGFDDDLLIGGAEGSVAVVAFGGADFWEGCPWVAIGFS